MSDLFCPATLILARHGELGPGSEAPGALTEPGQRQSAELAARLRPRNVAAVYASASSGPLETARIAADALDLEVAMAAGLTPRTDGDSSAQIVSMLRPVIEEISDLYRGETVLIVTDEDVISRGVRAIARLAPGVQPARIGHCGIVEIAVDADGVVCTEWDPGVGDDA